MRGYSLIPTQKQLINDINTLHFTLSTALSTLALSYAAFFDNLQYGTTLIGFLRLLIEHLLQHA